jgi:tripartite-type tricarboxylate transporter receptor subunit TctC
MRKYALALSMVASLSVNATPPTKVVVPYPVGGGTDIVARYFENKMAGKFYIENKAGASGMIGTDIVAKSAPNGKTLLMGHVTPNAIDVGQYMTPKVKTNWDLEPVVLVATARELLVANKSFPPNTLQELKEYAKNNIITYASDGIGSVADIMMAQTLKGYMTIHVPYKGGAPALQSVLMNETSLAYSPAPVVNQWSNSPLIKIIPTKTADDLWWGLFAPKGTDPKLLDKWHSDFVQILKEPTTAEWMKKQGYNINIISRKQFADFVKAEQEKYRPIDRTIKGIKDGQSP